MRISDWSSDVCSSDLSIRSVGWPTPAGTDWPPLPQIPTPSSSAMSLPMAVTFFSTSGPSRSEEHPSELQSLMRISYAGFCLIKQHSLRNPALRPGLRHHDRSTTESHHGNQTTEAYKS